MGNDHINVNLSCGSCGSSSIETEDTLSDSDPVRCRSCGAELGTYGEAKARAMKAAREQVEKQMREAFKGIPGFTFGR